MFDVPLLVCNQALGLISREDEGTIIPLTPGPAGTHGEAAAHCFVEVTHQHRAHSLIEVIAPNTSAKLRDQSSTTSDLLVILSQRIKALT